MHAVTVGFDVDGFASDQFRQIATSNGFASFKTKSLRLLVSLSSKSIIDFFGSVVGSVLVKLIRRDTQRVKAHALIFRGLRNDLRAQIAATGSLPSDRLLKKIDQSQASLVKLRAAVKNICFLLRQANENSRLASAFERLEKETNELMSAVYEFRLVAIGADIEECTWEQAVQASRQVMLNAAASIEIDDEAGIEPDLYAAALAAVEKSSLHRA